MILKRTTRPELSWTARLLFVAGALCILPLAPQAFSQNVDDAKGGKPPATTEPQTREDKRTVKLSTEERLERVETLLQQLLHGKPAPATQNLKEGGERPPSDKTDLLPQGKQEIAKLDSQIRALEAQLAGLRKQRQAAWEKLDRWSPKAGAPDEPKSQKSADWSSDKHADDAEVLKAPQLSKRAYLGELLANRSGQVSLGFGDDGLLRATEPKSGKVVWTLDLRDLGAISAINAAQDRLTIYGENKREIVVEAATGKILTEARPSKDPSSR